MINQNDLVYSVMNAYMDFVNCPKRPKEIQWLTEMEFQQLSEELERSGEFHLMGARLVEKGNGEVIAVKGYKVVPIHPTVFWRMVIGDQEYMRSLETMLKYAKAWKPMNGTITKLISRHAAVLMDQGCVERSHGEWRLTKGFRAYLERNGVCLKLE